MYKPAALLALLSVISGAFISTAVAFYPRHAGPALIGLAGGFGLALFLQAHNSNGLLMNATMMWPIVVGCSCLAGFALCLAPWTARLAQVFYGCWLGSMSLVLATDLFTATALCRILLMQTGELSVLRLTFGLICSDEGSRPLFPDGITEPLPYQICTSIWLVLFFVSVLHQLRLLPLFYDTYLSRYHAQTQSAHRAPPQWTEANYPTDDQPYYAETSPPAGESRPLSIIGMYQHVEHMPTQLAEADDGNVYYPADAPVQRYPPSKPAIGPAGLNERSIPHGSDVRSKRPPVARPLSESTSTIEMFVTKAVGSRSRTRLPDSDRSGDPPGYNGRDDRHQDLSAIDESSSGVLPAEDTTLISESLSQSGQLSNNLAGGRKGMTPRQRARSKKIARPDPTPLQPIDEGSTGEDASADGVWNGPKTYDREMQPRKLALAGSLSSLAVPLKSSMKRNPPKPLPISGIPTPPINNRIAASKAALPKYLAIPSNVGAVSTFSVDSDSPTRTNTKFLLVPAFKSKSKGSAPGKHG